MADDRRIVDHRESYILRLEGQLDAIRRQLNLISLQTVGPPERRRLKIALELVRYH
jgi:hypothetical protein